jgi:hypothetical protein
MVCSRSYLQNLAVERKKEVLSTIIGGFINDLKKCAAMGKKCYMYDQSNMRTLTMMIQSQYVLPISNDDLIAACKEIFVDCNVVYQEFFIEGGVRINKKGILIEWG